MVRKTLAHRVLSSLLDTLHHWSGSLLAQEGDPPVPPPASTTNLPATQATGYLAKQAMVALTVFLEPALADEVTRLSQAMQTSEQDVLIRLVKLAKMIREFGLYGVPTPDGNQLVVHLRNTNENHTVHLDCPAQQNHRPTTQSKPDSKPPSQLN